MANPIHRDAPLRADAAPSSPSVRTAVLLMYGLLGVIALRALLSLVAHDALLDAFAKSRDLDRSTEYGKFAVDTAAPAYTTIAIGSLVIFGVLLLLTAAFLRRGARWARVVATVVAVLNLLNIVVVFAQPAPIWFRLLGLAAALLGLAILVLLYRPDANAFFRRSRSGAVAG
jgi:hypothetical protein